MPFHCLLEGFIRLTFPRNPGQNMWRLVLNRYILQGSQHGARLAPPSWIRDMEVRLALVDNVGVVTHHGSSFLGLRQVRKPM